MRNHALFKEAGTDMKPPGLLIMLRYGINDLKLRISYPGW